MIGYRTQSCSAWPSGVMFPPFKAVLQYETLELGNRDIHWCMKHKHNLKLDIRRKSGYLNQQILHFLECNFGTKDLVCVWLCDNIADVYTYGNTDIYEVILPDIAMIVSDLGVDGKLYVFPLLQLSNVKANRIV